MIIVDKLAHLVCNVDNDCLTANLPIPVLRSPSEEMRIADGGRFLVDIFHVDEGTELDNSSIRTWNPKACQLQ